MKRKARIETNGVYKDFHWKIVCNPLGFRCGYVLIPEGHPWHGKSYDDLCDVDCHGGLTFSEMIKKKEGNFEPGYWIGFDCGHHNDAHDYECCDPEMDIEHFFPSSGVIRDKNYVEEECKKIIDQARKAT